MTVDELRETFAALADPTRRAILTRLADGEATVNELAEPFPITLQAVSKHLKVLERAGLAIRGRSAQLRSARSPRRSAGSRRQIGSRGDRPVLAGQLRPPRRAPPGFSSEDARMTQPSAKDDSLRLGISATGVSAVPRDRVWREWTDPEPCRLVRRLGRRGAAVDGVDERHARRHPGG